MRQSKGKLVALLAGAVVVVLVAVLIWKDVYCHLFLDPELVGRWKRDSGDIVNEFDRVGIWQVTERDRKASGTYRVDGDVLIMEFDRVAVGGTVAYRIEGDILTFDMHQTYRRVPDDS